MLEEDFKKINEILNGSSIKNGERQNNQQNVLTSQADNSSQIDANNNGTGSMPNEQASRRRSNTGNQFEDLHTTTGAPIDENANASQYDDDDESFNEHNRYSAGTGKRGRPANKKSKRGRKRKIRDTNEMSTDSDSEVFNYDKFMRKIGKKGSRVNATIRMHAVRTPVPGLKKAPVQNPKMSITEKMNNSMNEESSNVKGIKKKPLEISETTQPSRANTNGNKESEESVKEDMPKAIIDEMKQIEGEAYAGELDINSQKKMLQAYESNNTVKLYNLRERRSTKKYYDEDPDLDEELGIEGDSRMAYGYTGYKSGRNQTYGVNSNAPKRASTNEFKYQSKPKRKKRKDDDEDYIEEDDFEAEENDDYSPSLKNKNSGKYNPSMYNDYQMRNQMPMQNHMMHQNNMSKFDLMKIFGHMI